MFGSKRTETVDPKPCHVSDAELLDRDKIAGITSVDVAAATYAGLEDFLTKVYTPGVDLVLFIPMLVTALCMVIFWRRVRHERRWRSIVYWIIETYVWASVPIHLRSQLLQSNDFVFAFPGWYSVALQPWLALQLYFFLTIKVKPHPVGSGLR
jgi:hypothetical protein